MTFSSEARESRYEEFLLPVFKDEVKSRSRNPEKRKEKFESNSLFDSKARLDKTVKDLAKTDNKVWCFVCIFILVLLDFFSLVRLSGSRLALALLLPDLDPGTRPSNTLGRTRGTTGTSRVDTTTGPTTRGPGRPSTRLGTGPGKTPGTLLRRMTSLGASPKVSYQPLSYPCGSKTN